MLSGTLAENPGSALLYGEPGCGKSTLALKFAWQTRGAFDAVVFQLCGQRSVAEIAAELARKLKLGFETRPPEEHIAAIKAWLAERRLCWCWTTSGKARWKRWCPVLRSRCSARLAGSFDGAQETGSALHGAGRSAARSEGCMLIS